MLGRGERPLDTNVGLAEGLDYAHAQDPPVLHCDIKPGNIIITPDHEAKLLDFGIAQGIQESVTRLTGQATMTPLYASPEQLRGEPLAAASDTYSLAAVLYECLAGQPCIAPRGNLAWQILHREYVPLETACPCVNAALEAGLAKSPGNRPGSAVQLLHMVSPVGGQEVHPAPGCARCPTCWGRRSW